MPDVSTSSLLTPDIAVRDGASSQGTSDHENDAMCNNHATTDTACIERATLRQIDLRLLPLLGMLYALAVIDRSNLGIARVAGMDRDLKLSIGSRYSIISAVYFPPYVLFQLPSNLVLRRLGVRNWLASCIIAWGAVQLSMGFVPDWKLLAFCRVLLGAFEAGFFPALVLIITSWYTRHEVQKRLGAFFLVSILAGGFSAIFGYLLTLLNGKLGIAGWAWIFIVEGAITVIFGFISWFFLSDFPDRNTFLTKEQTEFVLQRLERDRGDSVPDILTKDKVIEHLQDWTVWVFALMYLCATVPAYGIGFFISIILRAAGWSITESLLLSTPPYVFASISIFFFSWISDKYRTRALFITIQTVLTIIGLCITGFCRSVAWRYAGLFIAVAGCTGCIPSILAYESSNNVTTHSKRAVTAAVGLSVGGVGGVFASAVFRQVDFPRYLPGIYASIACQIFLLCMLAITTIHFHVENTKILAGGESPFGENSNFKLYTL